MKAELTSPGTSGAPAPQAYAKAMAADPGNFLPYLGYGQWALGHGNPARAAGWLERAVARNPASRPARFYLGLAYLEQGRLDQATAQFRQSDVLAKYLVYRAWQHVLRIREQDAQNRDWTPAERYYRAAVALNPGDRTLWRYLAEFYFLWPQDDDQALRTLEAAVQAFPTWSLPHLHIARILWWHGHDVPGALAEVDEAMRVEPDDVEAYLLRADILRNEGDVAAAEAWLRQATQVAPENAKAFFYLGELYREAGDQEQALAAYRRVLELSPDDTRAQRALDEMATDNRR